MKKTWTSLFGVLLAIVMVCTLIPSMGTYAHADRGIVGRGSCGDNLTWVLDDEGILTISGTGNMTTFSDGYIGPWYTINYNNTSSLIKTIIIEEGVTSVGGSAFPFLHNLTSVSLPESLTIINNNAFQGCDKLKTITVLSNVTSIEEYAFKDCSSLENVMIPGCIIRIGKYAFDGCNKLTNIYYTGTPDERDNIYIGGNNTRIWAARWHFCLQYGSLGLNASWTLSSDGVMTIGDKGEIPDYASESQPWNEFRESIHCINISDEITSIGDYAFGGCDELSYVFIPNSVIKVGENAFSGCANISEVYYKGDQSQSEMIAIGCNNECLTSAEWLYINEGGFCGDNVRWWLNANGELNIAGSGNIYDCYYENSNINNKLPAWYALRSSVISANLHSGVTGIGDYVFADCENMRELAIPDSLNSIGYDPFYGCISLTDIIVHADNHVFSAENGVLFNNDKTELIRCAPGKTGQYSMPLSVTSVLDSAFKDCNQLTDITFSDNISVISPYAFYNCYELASVTFPVSLNTIEPYAFKNCISLNDVYYAGSFYQRTEIEIGEGNDTILAADWHCSDGSIAGGACGDNLSWILYENGDLVVCGEGEMTDFEGGNSPWRSRKDRINSVYIEEGVTSIGDWAFYECGELETIDIPNGITSIGTGAFSGCAGLAEISLPDSVTSIGSTALGKCYNLKEIRLPYGITELSEELFYHCVQLSEIIIPNGVTYIGFNAFNGCTSLTNVTIPVAVDTISASAFGGCNQLSDVYYEGTETQKEMITIYIGNDPLINAYWHYAEPNSALHPVYLLDYTNGLADINGIVTGGEYSGETTFTVSCGNTCIVLCSKDGGETYERLDATAVENGYSFTIDVDSEVEIAIALLGDATLDGKVNTTDITQMKRFIANKRTFNAVQAFASNVNSDNKVNTTDVTQVKRFIAGKRTFEW